MKKIIIASTVAAIGVAGLVGGTAFATSQSSDGSDSLVSAIASKFNLNKDEVQKVFDEQRTKQNTEREQKVKDELAQLVKDGKLTQEQADKIIAKRAELQKEREANKPTTKPSELTDEQKAAKQKEMQTKKTELEQWLKDNGISTDYAKYLIGGKGSRAGGNQMGAPSTTRSSS